MEAIEKAGALLLLIGLGVLLRSKVKHPEALSGVKSLILSVALPATIFVALLKSRIEPSLLFLPLLTLVFNVVLMKVSQLALPFIGVEREGATMRTLLMLLPSLAPGLSSFPFILEYLGDDMLARAALADVGNKVFGLIVLYLVAMHWYYQLHGQQQESVSKWQNLKNLVQSLFQEPVNVVIILALGMLVLGWNKGDLPYFLADPLDKLNALMTPLVLLFIGMAAKFKRQELLMVLKLLTFRSGLAFCWSALMMSIFPMNSSLEALLIVALPQSSCSFWPFAHMSIIQGLEDKLPEKQEQKRTFDLPLAINLLALSLPFSTVIVLAVCSSGNFFAHTLDVWLAGGAMLLITAFLELSRNSFRFSAFVSNRQALLK